MMGYPYRQGGSGEVLHLVCPQFDRLETTDQNPNHSNPSPRRRTLRSTINDFNRADSSYRRSIDTQS